MFGCMNERAGKRHHQLRGCLCLSRLFLLQPETEQGRRTSLEKFTRSVVSVNIKTHNIHDYRLDVMLLIHQNEK